MVWQDSVYKLTLQNCTVALPTPPLPNHQQLSCLKQLCHLGCAVSTAMADRIVSEPWVRRAEQFRYNQQINVSLTAQWQIQINKHPRLGECSTVSLLYAQTGIRQKRPNVLRMAVPGGWGYNSRSSHPRARLSRKGAHGVSTYHPDGKGKPRASLSLTSS